MPPWIAALLGVVEGLTEYLPVSSTGHLILVGHWLHVEGDAAKDFEVVIQLGAVLAVVVHYRTLLLTRAKGLFRGDRDSKQLLAVLAGAFIPTAIIGFALRKTIKHHLFGPKPVVAALLVGGIGMIVVERMLAKKPETVRVTRLEDVDVKTAIGVGFAQCLALWPGASRSMCTILGGRLLGLSTMVAAELSFLVALPTLGAATALDLIKGGKALLGDSSMRLAVIIGFVVSFFVAWAVIGLFLRFLQRRGLEPFGWYRIALACVVLVSIIRP